MLLYACTLPLWEGWDEPFHYGYVENLAVFHQIPVLGKSTITAEIANSLLDTPLPVFLATPVHGSTSLSEWHSLSQAEKTALRTKLLSVPPSQRYLPAPNPNYEAQQAPLAYALLTPVDWLLANVQLLHRILLLRIVESVATILLLFFGLQRLASAAQLSEPFRSAAIYCSIATDALWASMAHVGNDAVAIALTVWLCALLSENKRPLAASLVFAAGLLTKAYFLAFAPVFYLWLFLQPSRRRILAALLPLLIAGPWYLRNLRLYSSISGTQETVQHHVTFASALSAAPHINWLRSVSTFWRAALWTGNWSSIAFSRGALYVEASLMLIGLVLCAFVARPRTGWLWAASASLALALVYQTCVTWVASGGMASTEPWYGQGILAASWVLIFAGFSAIRRIGKLLSLALCCLIACIAIVSFPLVLLPYYGAGLKYGAALRWWFGAPLRQLRFILPASPNVSIALLLLFTLLVIWNLAELLSAFYRPSSRNR